MSGSSIEKTKTVTASAVSKTLPNTWEIEFEAPKYDASGSEIAYTVTESAISGFRAKVEGTKESGFTITNVEQEKLKVIKTWIGAEGDKITIRIKDADNSNELYVRTVYKTDTDINRITNPDRPNITIWEIPVAVDKVDITGKNITYSVDEEALPNYGKTITVNTGDKTVTITNTEEVNIKVIKKWIGKVGDKITVNLMSGSAIVDTKVVTESAVVNGDKSTWEVVFKAVPKYDATGKAIEYTVDEKDMTNYKNTITDNKDNSFTIANKEMPNNKNEKVVIKITKKWIGKTEKEITILLKNGDTVVERKLVTESAIKDGDKNTWEVSFEAPKHDADGKEINYTVDEQPVSGYVKTISGNQKDGFTITNAEGITVKVTKKWEGKVGDTITVVLKNGNTDIERRIVTKAAVVSGEIATWQIAFEAAKRDTSGNEIKYNVEEEAVTGYTTSITGDYKAGFIITNKEKPQEPSTPPTPPTPPTPIIPPTPPTPIIPPYIPPYIPPTPSIPEIPVTPDPIPKDVPKFPSDKTPDPNKPGSPDDFVTVDKDGTPKGRYVKSKKPNGKNTYIEVNLDGTPKGVLPRTGSADNTVYYVGGCTLLLFAGLIMLKKRKRSNN